MPTARRFPPPWTIEEHNAACFIVRDATGQALAYVYFGRSPVSRQLRRARGAAAPRSIGPGRTQQMPNSRHLSEAQLFLICSNDGFPIVRFVPEATLPQLISLSKAASVL